MTPHCRTPLTQLARCLRDNDSEAVDVFEAARPLFAAAGSPADVASLEQAIRSFDFDAALPILTGIAGKHDITA